jgi:RNA recognition motif-containing protein
MLKMTLRACMRRDKETGKSRGFAFLAYEDQRSTVLAVDNLSGARVAGRIVRVDHVDNYKVKRAEVRSEPMQVSGSLATVPVFTRDSHAKRYGQHLHADGEFSKFHVGLPCHFLTGLRLPKCTICA